MHTSTGTQELPDGNRRHSIDRPFHTHRHPYADRLSTAHWEIARQSLDLLASSSRTEIAHNSFSITIHLDAPQATATAGAAERTKEPETCPDPRHPRLANKRYIFHDDGTARIFEDEGQR